MSTAIEWTATTGRVMGALKSAAKRVGLTVEEYLQKREAGLKRCIVCKAWKDREREFALDRSRSDGFAARCLDCNAAKGRAEYVPVPEHLRQRRGPPRIRARDGDKLQARRRINHDVERGIRPHPDALHCVYCGHKGPDRRHEYHHHLGYAPEHHNDVFPACSACHHEQEAA